MTFPTSYVKLADGSWGVRVPPMGRFTPKAGDRISVSTRSGADKYETLAEYQGRNRYGDSLWSIVPQVREPVASQAVGDLGGVLALFAKAKQHLKSPAIVLAVEGLPGAPAGSDPVLGGLRTPYATLRLTIAGPKAKVPGSITVTDNDKYVENDWGGESREWLGRVTVDGTYQPARAANGRTEPIAKALAELAKDPATVAARSGKLTGRCCFCNHRLGEGKDQRSVAVGYGPDCAAHFGVPWGEAKGFFAAPVAKLSDGTAEDEPFEPVGRADNPTDETN